MVNFFAMYIITMMLELVRVANHPAPPNYLNKNTMGHLMY